MLKQVFILANFSLSTLFGLIIYSPCIATEIYKCRDEAGVSYSDKPCAKESQVFISKQAGGLIDTGHGLVYPEDKQGFVNTKNECNGPTSEIQGGYGFKLDYISNAIIVKYSENDSITYVGNSPDAGFVHGMNFNGNLCGNDLLREIGFELSGTDNAEIITGTLVNDRIIGKQGNDVLAGGKGNDTYVYNLGDGLDCVLDSSGANDIEFGPGIQAENIAIIQRETTGKKVEYLALVTGDSAKLITGLLYRNNTPPIENLIFSNGVRISYTELSKKSNDTLPIDQHDICSFDISGTTNGLIDQRRNKKIETKLPEHFRAPKMTSDMVILRGPEDSVKPSK